MADKIGASAAFGRVMMFVDRFGGHFLIDGSDIDFKSKGKVEMFINGFGGRVVMRGREDKGDKSAVHMGINEYGGSILVVPVGDLGGGIDFGVGGNVGIGLNQDGGGYVQVRDEEGVPRILD